MSPTIYTIVVTNNGPDAVNGATVTDNVPLLLENAVWTCTASTGSSCGAASGTGNISTTVNLLTGGTATFSVTANVASSSAGTLSNTVAVEPPAGTGDPNPNNNSATDADTITAPTAAPAFVAGRVVAGEGRGISGARVSITDESGQIRYALTNTFGFYHFEEVAVGQTYIFQARHKSYVFAAQVVNVTGDIENLNFFAAPPTETK